jgi:two-component sensor histidine kinase
LATQESDDAPVEELLDTPNLSDALESDRFKQFLDHVPFGVAVAELRPAERLTYVNLEFERLLGRPAAELQGQDWGALPVTAISTVSGLPLNRVITEQDDYLGVFAVSLESGSHSVDAWANIIEDDAGTPTFRLVALAPVQAPDSEDVKRQLNDKDTLLRELQHRVKNNLQMITALIRLEARNMPEGASGAAFQRLAGRVSSLALLYQSLTEETLGDSVDLGVYLSQIASAVMAAHAVEGIRLDLQVDTWPVSVNVAMPTGLVVNELLTNALKYAFVGRDGGIIALHSLVNETGCLVTISDDGVGLGEGVSWPKPGKLSALIVHSLEQNAHAKLAVHSAAGQGTKVSIFFARADAAPEPA